LEERIELLKKIKIKLQGHAYIGKEKREGWKKPTSIYMFECPKHGYVKSSVKGYDERLECPKCLEELLDYRVTA
jgi:hypothetical protein